ncbi:hypothetical protein ACFX2I_016115 [Malus domestica]
MGAVDMHHDHVYYDDYVHESNRTPAIITVITGHGPSPVTIISVCLPREKPGAAGRKNTPLQGAKAGNNSSRLRHLGSHTVLNKVVPSIKVFIFLASPFVAVAVYPIDLSPHTTVRIE